MMNPTDIASLAKEMKLISYPPPLAVYVDFVENVAQKACLAYMTEGRASFPRLAEEINATSCLLVSMYANIPASPEKLTKENPHIEKLLADSVNKDGNFDVRTLRLAVAASHKRIQESAIGLAPAFVSPTASF